MSFLQKALSLAAEGFYVFPLAPGTKDGVLVDSHKTGSSRDPARIRAWWLDPVLEIEQPFNIGISTHRFGENQSLLVVDVDIKNGKRGDLGILELELQGFEFPETRTQETASGGRHYVYLLPGEPVGQGADVLGVGIDVRSRGGFIVGDGSCIGERLYTATSHPVVSAPGWLIERLSQSNDRSERERDSAGRNRPAADVDLEAVKKRAAAYLRESAAPALEGQGGDHTTFKVACWVKDYGLDAGTALELMLEHWNPRCEPPWDAQELETKIKNAYRYGNDRAGSKSAEAEFAELEDEDEVDEAPTKDPISTLNDEFAFVIAGGGAHILWETKDHHGRFRLEHVGITAFHQKLAASTITLGNGRTHPLSELWMKSKQRRSFDGICFRPGLESPPNFYNLWRGFAYAKWDLPEKEASAEARESVEAFIDHARTNVCRGDEKLFRWLIGYFAHLVQRPWEKPLVSLVFRGSKGTGKNALIERVGTLLGPHFLLTSNRRYLIGNFNGHLENCLLFALDEAFWSGDKQAEGTLKDLITGTAHVIEHKGKEPYTVENCTRVVIIGNEEWLVPATQDERRFAVFDVGDGRKQDNAYFEAMRVGMERGGYRLLLRYLLDFPFDPAAVNRAPRTLALLDQKVASLDPFYQWWLESLRDGRLAAAEFGGEWPSPMVPKESVRNAYRRYMRDRNIKGRVHEDIALGKLFKKAVQSLDASGKKRDGAELVNTYKIPDLAGCRKEWENFIGHPVEWA